jgi:hypothetical protein
MHCRSRIRTVMVVGIGEVQVKGGDRVRQVMRLVAPTMGAQTTGLCSTHAKATWGRLGWPR